MTISLTSPVTGAAQTGFTAPTYTTAADASGVDSKKYVVTALGGTQTGVVVHSISNPFAIEFRRPSAYKTVGQPNPSTNILSSQPKNKFSVKTIKGVLPLAGQSAQMLVIRTEIEIPAGADTADAPNIRAAYAAHIGALTQQSAGLGDTSVQGTI